MDGLRWNRNIKNLIEQSFFAGYTVYKNFAAVQSREDVPIFLLIAASSSSEALTGQLGSC
jgi:hypothetical protein